MSFKLYQFSWGLRVLLMAMAMAMAEGYGYGSWLWLIAMYMILAHGYGYGYGLAFLITPTLVAVAVAEGTSFLFNGFHQNISSMSLSGSAALDSSGIIRLTNFSSDIFGHALYRHPLLVKTNNTTVSFSTTFVFSITPQYPPISGAGLAFFVTPTLDNSNVTSAQYLGLLNSSRNGNSSNHLFAVEFDTIQDLQFADRDDNHVGVNVNSMTSVTSATAAYFTGPNQLQPLNLKGGQNIQVWIHYDGILQELNVSIANVGQSQPLFPLLSTPLILSAYLLDTAYVGFSGTTEPVPSIQSILAWSFNSNGPASPLDLSRLPILIVKATSESKWTIVGFTLFALIVFCAVAYALLSLYRRRQRLLREERMEDWEIEYGPHRFSYRIMSEATKRFAEERLVGEGGFGVVYRGVLPSTGDEVAVKRLSNRSQQGVREFMAELSSMGRLRHRNLVQLQGWSRRRGSGELLLVYEYMSNGSLDKMLYHSSSPPLSWPQRYNILKDVAAALVYLHEEWEQQVLHRDVKSNNILLDASLNGKLGDFGLARLHEHGKIAQTTLVIGTLGYLAPEYSRTGKPTALSDVFSFGAVMLEVACGRRPLDYERPDEEERVLADWVRGLLLQGRLVEASDPKLCNEYVKEEMEYVLQLGLLCCHPNPEVRPPMRRVLQTLTGAEPLPLMPPFETLYHSASSSNLNWSIFPKISSHNTSLASTHDTNASDNSTLITGR